MNLRSVDLNVLIALEALLLEQHVSRAAERVGLSQPAMSNALARLRVAFRDELLVRTATGMRSTPRAEKLLEQIQQLLRQIEELFEGDDSFAPENSKRKFTVRMSDLLGFLFLPGLLDRVEATAPDIRLDVLHLPPARTVDALEIGEIEVAVGTGLDHSVSISSEILFQDTMVGVMRKSHPLAEEALTLEGFLGQKRLNVATAPKDLRFVDDVLVRERLGHDVGLSVPNWLVAPHVLARVDYLAVMPGRLAAEIAGSALIVRELPFVSRPFDWRLYWHRRHERNPAITWLRDQIRAVATTVAASKR